jgi:uncharacterized protein with von Willebrand factor type A (vWA) domain
MQGALADFLRALRATDVRVSPSEAIDAHLAVAAVGYGDRSLLKDALCVTLAKSTGEIDRFEACFDTFFTRTAFSEAPPPVSERTLEGAPPLAEMLLANDTTGLAQAIEAAAAGVGAGDIRLTTQRGLLTRRMLDAMGLRDLEAMIQALRESAGPDDQAMAERLGERRGALFAEAGRFMERQSRLHAGQTGRRLREAILTEQRLTAIDPADEAVMAALVRRLARRLASRHARRRRSARAGALDVRATLRKSLGHGGVPFEIVWRRRKIDRPKIAVLCDVSRSVAGAARFLLLFLHGLHEAVERLDAFAFSDRLVDVGDLLDDETVDDAIPLVLRRIGFRPTDYGRALDDFLGLHGPRLDRRTTVIILGDGRSNHADPRLDLMGEISARARSVIWLNPEPETYWGQGDSRMDAYRRFCRVARPCNTLKGLERVIDEVLTASSPR